MNFKNLFVLIISSILCLIAIIDCGCTKDAATTTALPKVGECFSCQKGPSIPISNNPRVVGCNCCFQGWWNKFYCANGYYQNRDSCPSALTLTCSSFGSWGVNNCFNSNGNLGSCNWAETKLYG